MYLTISNINIYIYIERERERERDRERERERVMIDFVRQVGVNLLFRYGVNKVKTTKLKTIRFKSLLSMYRSIVKYFKFYGYCSVDLSVKKTIDAL